MSERFSQAAEHEASDHRRSRPRGGRQRLDGGSRPQRARPGAGGPRGEGADNRAAIGFHAEQAIRQRLTEEKPSRTFGFLLQREKGAFYRAVAEALKQAVEAAPTIRGRFRVEFLEDLTPAFVADRIAALAKTVDAIGVVAADHPRVAHAIEQAAARGVPAVALISDLTAPLRAGYVGLDNWKVGRTAAWAVAHMARPEGRVAILVGSHRYLCQDVAEMSFRSYMREHAPGFGVMESVTTFEDPGYAYENTLDLIRRTPDLAALWDAGGGIEGVLQAISDAGVAERLVTIGRDLTEDTRAGLLDGTIRLDSGAPDAADGDCGRGRNGGRNGWGGGRVPAAAAAVRVVDGRECLGVVPERHELTWMSDLGGNVLSGFSRTIIGAGHPVARRTGRELAHWARNQPGNREGGWSRSQTPAAPIQ